MDIREFPNLCGQNYFLTIPYLTREEIDYWNEYPTRFDTNHYFLIFFEVDEIGSEPTIMINNLNKNRKIENINDEIKYEIVITIPVNNKMDYWDINVGHIPFFVKGMCFSVIQDYYDLYKIHIDEILFEKRDEDEFIPHCKMYSILIEDKIITNRLILNNQSNIKKAPILEDEYEYGHNIDYKSEILFPISSEQDIELWNNNPFICEEKQFVVFLELGIKPFIRINHRETLRIDIPDNIITEITLVIPRNILLNNYKSDSNNRWIIDVCNIPFFCEEAVERSNLKFWSYDNAELYSWMFEQHMYCLKNKVKPISINDFIDQQTKK